MNTDEILATLTAAGTFLKNPIQSVTAQAVEDAYQQIKGYLRSKFAAQPDALDALTKLNEKPESKARSAVLAEEAADLGSDTKLVKLATDLAGLLSTGGTIKQRVSVKGSRNNVKVAGRDLIITEKHVQRNSITPDERHISGEQNAQLQKVNKELALRLAREDGKPNYAAGFVALQKHFNVSSHLLIPREKFDEAMSFLKQKRAMNRGKLRSRNPHEYSRDLYRAIYTRASVLGWNQPQLYQFAFEKLTLKKPINSLKELGSIQLKTLSECVHQAEKKLPKPDKVSEEE